MSPKAWSGHFYHFNDTLNCSPAAVIQLLLLKRENTAAILLPCLSSRVLCMQTLVIAAGHSVVVKLHC